MSYNEAAINEVLSLAIEHHQKRNFSDAEKLYRAILQASPNHPDANYNFGILALDMGYAKESIPFFETAINNRPLVEAYYLGYIDAYKIIEAHEKNISASSKISSQTSIKLIQKELGKWSKLHNKGNHKEAEKISREMIKKYPKVGMAWKTLGITLIDKEQYIESLCINKTALKLLPEDHEIPYNIGVAFQLLGMLKAAAIAYSRAIDMKPDYLEAHNNLGTVLQKQGDFAGGIAAYEKALSIKSDTYKVHNNIGFALSNQGMFIEADGYFNKALELESDFEGAFSNLLFSLNYHPDKSPEEIYEAYKEYNKRFVLPFSKYHKTHNNVKNSNRRLKVGYVSGDFNLHSVRFFLEPLLANHNHTAVEVYAYAELTKEDEMSQKYKSYCDHWIPTAGMSNDALAEKIREDEIDILVDLSGQTAGNRLEVFARKPAPVSLSWLGYGYTTGVSAIDYYLTDEVSVPLGSEHLFAEKPWRMDQPSFVYSPAAGMGEVNPLPALEKGYVTFGTLTRSIRVNHRTIKAWAELLKRVPDSKLIINSKDYQTSAMQEKLAERFREHEIDKERLEIGYRSPPWDVLRSIDIGVDCFPHNSGTTLFETLYMGIPYVTLLGRPSVGRLGSSILHGLGRDEWIANSEEEYIEKLVAISGDIPALSQLRAGLRDEMRQSKLMDGAGFARKVEEAYQKMFTLWCEEQK
ncbi:tetratricopeptide repeat protein [Sulfurimonas sp.]|jgi:predicted O-linked N-acetylglucosamine transferase (SPINDLY family)|uniref:O-linked N-acetylglucosamine transferase, SPINDLY family protein n=1 Tax=Sulfurimonas sp. TaxID=2022749 RepID=UPI002A35C8EE|nr:tetratricopeptide repeat protein [Sulfurimonas sp.]MDY0122774.1 tetratricopeptide repeat protein [Sulfurimonas sp.]